MREVQLSGYRSIALLSIFTIVACCHLRKGNTVLNHQESQAAIAELREAYAAFNRGDIDTAVRFLDPQIEWTEPTEFPGGGTYHGVDGARQYLTQSRASVVQVISTPEQFIPAGDRIVVFVHARVLPRESNTWQDIRLADVYTVQNGRATKMRAFANREEALRWVGIGNNPQ